MAPPTVVLADPGDAAFAALRDRLGEVKHDDALARATVVVPSNFVGVATRRRLAATGVAGRPGVAGIQILTTYRLAELLGAPSLAAAGRRPVSTPVLAAALRRQLRDDPGVFGPVADHVATEQALVSAFRELADIEPAARAALGRQGRRAADVVRLCEEARAELSAAWYDEADLVDAARAALTAETPLVAELGAVVIHLPRRLRRRPATLLAAVADVVPTTVVGALVPGVGVSADLGRSLSLLGAVAPRVTTAPSLPTVDLVRSASDADDEVRAALRTVVDEVRCGTPLDRIGVAHAAPDPYTRLIHEHFGAAGIERNGAAVRSVAERMVGRFLLSLLRLPERRWRRDDVIGLLAGAPTRRPDGGWVPSARWEEASRAAGVVAGLDDWDARLRRHADRCRAEVEQLETDPEASEGRLDWLRGEATAAEELRTFVLALADRLASAPTTWRELARWAHDVLDDLLGNPPMRSRWPEGELDAADRVSEALDRLGGLDEVDPRADLDTFARTLELELETDLGRIGVLGRGVLVGRIDDMLGLDLDLLVVVGLAEGTFPTRRLDDSLLPDHERVSAGAELLTRADHTAADRDDLMRAVASAGRVVASFPRGDLRRTAERVPSRWLLDLVEARRVREGETDWARALPPPSTEWLDVIPSFAGSVGRVTFGGSDQEQRLVVLARSGSTSDLVDHPLVVADRSLRAGVELVRGRASRDFTRFDGNLAGRTVRSPADPGVVMGPTRLEHYVKNPHRYLMETILRVRTDDDPEAQHQISALDYGNVVHWALERFLESGIERGDLPDPGRPWSAGQVERLLRIADECWSEYRADGRVGRPVFEHGDRRRFDADIRRFITADDEFRHAHELRPVAAELSFGFGDGIGAVSFDLGDGRAVRFHGSADRVDRAPDGRIVVTDYKTGSTWRFKGIEPTAPTAGGTKLQLPVYALAGRAAVGDPDAPVHARYWFVTEKHGFAEIGFDVTDEVLDEFREVLRTIVDEIEAGHFPMRPPEPVWRHFVEDVFADPDGLGTADRWREWERIRTHPDLARFVALAEGIPGEEE